MKEEAAVQVRCYSCKSRQDRAAEACTRCRAPFRSICACGVEISRFDAKCAKCGAAITRRTRTKSIWKRPRTWVALGVLVVAAGASTYLLFHGSDIPVWRLKQLGVEKFQRGDFEGAAKDFER